MTSEVKTLIDDTIELTGAARPALLEGDAPVLGADALEDGRSTEGGLYFVGLIGGKEVGKSTLVNALVGSTITEPTSFGPGTEQVIAYAHHSATEAVRALLEREVSGRFLIVPHNVTGLSRQVLLDLPDIDSHWTEHVALTRRMLRHMLYPLWMQSIEKYADQQPQRLLSQVAAGNDPANFVFCLNKADQLISREGQAAADELRADYAGRLAKTLSLATPPRVYLISAAEPGAFDLPALRAAVSNQKTTQLVQQSKRLAGKRQDRSLLAWLEGQQLPERAERAARLLDESEELLRERVAVPLLEQSIPRLSDDAGYRLSIIEPAVHARLSHWPLVNILDSALLPLTALVRRNVGTVAQATPDAYLRPGERGVAEKVQAAFAQLHQTHPGVAALYRNRKLWETVPAADAADALRGRLAGVIDRQRAEAVRRAARSRAIFAPLRWLLTVGAAVWFALVQPVMQASLDTTWAGFSRHLLVLAVQLFSAAYLLKAIGFLALYFLVLWAVLRWDTHRRVSRLMAGWASLNADPALSLSAQTVGWLDELAEPLRGHLNQVNELAKRTALLRAALDQK